MIIRLAVDSVDYYVAAASVSYTNATVGRPQYIEVEARDTPRLIFFDRDGGGQAFETLPQTFLPGESVSISDGENEDFTTETQFEVDIVKGAAGTDEDDVVEVTDTDPIFDIDLAKTDSVTVTETRVKVFTDFIDFDPSDADIDATPVTIAEADAKDVDKPFSDATSATEAISNQPDLPKTDAVTTSEAVDRFDIGANPTDTATASEAIDRFDVTTEFDDTVAVTEAIENEVTTPKSDSVAAVQSNVKTFTSNVDFDLSDADVDPDPVTASDAINDFDVDKGLTDTATATEADAKNFTHGGFTDTATATEAAELDVTVPSIADSFTAVEGIKLNPELPFGHSVSATESNVFDIRPALSETATATESINTTLTLGDLTFIYPDFVTVSDGYIGGFIEEPYSYTISSTEYFVPNTGVIGAAETLNTVIMAADRVTAPDESSSGLVVNFHYTDVDEDDRALGGYQFNQTPLNPGNSTVGQRAIL